jgi:alkylation response protein AidB-like acyl-CoA dehydrogenase
MHVLPEPINDPRISDDVRALLKSISDFIDREVRPLEQEHADVVIDGGVNPRFRELANHVQRASVNAGYYAMHMPADAGGAGLGELEMCLVRESIAASGTMLTLNMLGDLPFGPNRMLYELATPAQRERYLLPLVRGEFTTCFALSEPEAGSDLGGIQTKAVRDGDGFVLNGQKHFITNAPYADFAHVLAVADAGHTFFLVDRDTPGLEIGRIQRSMADDDLQAELFFRDCRVPASAMLGREGQAFTYAAAFLSGERLAIAATANGIAECLVRMCIEHARARKQFGKPIASFQAIQWMIADSITELYAARTMLHDAAYRTDQGENVFREVSMAKVFCTETVGRIADRAVQIHGGAGYMRACPVERYYRLVRVLRIGGGTSEIQRLIIAKASGL